MCWWKTALCDTCSLITLDKAILEQAALEEHFPTSMMALEESFTVDQMYPNTAERMRGRVTIRPLPTPAELAAILASANLSRALSEVDTLVYATAVHNRLAVVTGDILLGKAVKAAGLPVGNFVMIVRDLVSANELTKKGCEHLLAGLAERKDFLLKGPMPTWSEIYSHSFPE